MPALLPLSGCSRYSTAGRCGLLISFGRDAYGVSLEDSPSVPAATARPRLLDAFYSWQILHSVAAHAWYLHVLACGCWSDCCMSRAEPVWHCNRLDPSDSMAAAMCQRRRTRSATQGCRYSPTRGSCLKCRLLTSCTVRKLFVHLRLRPFKDHPIMLGLSVRHTSAHTSASSMYLVMTRLDMTKCMHTNDATRSCIADLLASTRTVTIEMHMLPL